MSWSRTVNQVISLADEFHASLICALPKCIWSGVVLTTCQCCPSWHCFSHLSQLASKFYSFSTHVKQQTLALALESEAAQERAVRSKDMKGCKECCLLGWNTTCTFFGKSPLSSYKTTLKQKLNGEKWWTLRWGAKRRICFGLSYVVFLSSACRYVGMLDLLDFAWWQPPQSLIFTW